MPEPSITLIITALFILAALIIVLKSLSLPNNFVARQKERQELRRQIIKNEILKKELLESEKTPPV